MSGYMDPRYKKQDDLPMEIRNAIGEPINFFPPCVFREATERYPIACTNEDATLYLQPCSKRCTQNVEPDLYQLKKRAEELKAKLKAMTTEEDEQEKIKQIKKELREADSAAFNAYLRWAKDEVATWPEWKRCIWQRGSNMEEPKGTQEIARSERAEYPPTAGPNERLPHPEEHAALEEVGKSMLGKKPVANPSNLKEGNIIGELWRAYTWIIPETGQERTVTIKNPLKVMWRKGGETHRVVDNDGVVTCVPAPGRFGCALTWLNKDPHVPVNW